MAKTFHQEMEKLADKLPKESKYTKVYRGEKEEDVL